MEAGALGFTGFNPTYGFQLLRDGTEAVPYRGRDSEWGLYGSSIAVIIHSLHPSLFIRLIATTNRITYYTSSTAGCVFKERKQIIAETDCFAQIIHPVATLPVNPYILQRK